MTTPVYIYYRLHDHQHHHDYLGGAHAAQERTYLSIG